jgi:hypothetical protein
MFKKITLLTLLPVITFVFMFVFPKPAFGIDVYVPLTFEGEVRRGLESLVEFTVLSNTRIEGVPQGIGWSNEERYHYLLELRIDDVIIEGLFRRSGNYIYQTMVNDDTWRWSNI